MAEEKKERIAKIMARAGLCSRREAERWIKQGRVCVNGSVLDHPAIIVSGSDDIIVDGKSLPCAEKTRLFLYHKPVGLVTSAKDEMGRKTVFDALPDHLPRLVSVGRLDLNTEGLLLLTNDGELSRHLELPSTAWKRRYRVRAYGYVTQARLDTLGNGVVVDGIKYGSIEATLDCQKDEQADKQRGKNCWITLVLKEGKNREVRKVMEHLGLRANRLLRLSYGPFQLGDLSVNDVKEVSQKVLKEQLSSFIK